MAGGRRPYYTNRPTRRPTKRPTRRPVTKMQDRGINVHPTPAKKKVKTKNGFKIDIINKFSDIDYTFVLIVFVLLAFGLAILLSASTPAANTKTGKSYYFFIRQLCGIGVGTVLMMIFAVVDYHWYKKAVPLFFLVGVLALIACRIPGIGEERNGAWRWLRTPVIQLQPSEIMKPLMIMFTAKIITEGRNRFETFKDLIPFLMIMGLVGAIMLFLQSHASGAFVLCFLCVIITLVAGAKLRYYIYLGISLSPLAIAYIMQDKMRLGRILSLIDPFRDSGKKSYQIIQSLIAIGTGGFFGKGLGQGMQKYGYLPEAYNDFIFAVVCEELGFLGAFIIMVLFAALIIRGVKIALEAPDAYGMLIVVGIIAQIAVQTVCNIAVVCSAMPNTGIALPFFSFGGTGIMILIAEIGVVINVSMQSMRPKSIPE